MIVLGQYCTLKVSKKVEFGYYLGVKFGDEVLLPKGAAKWHDIKECEK